MAPKFDLVFFSSVSWASAETSKGESGCKILQILHRTVAFQILQVNEFVLIKIAVEVTTFCRNQ